jgi:aminopeptidase N
MDTMAGLLRLLGLTLILAWQCGQLAHAHDPLSFSRPDLVSMRTLHLQLDADFASRTLAGYAELRLQWHAPGQTSLTLDTRDLQIEKVEIPAPQPPRQRGQRGQPWQRVPHQLGTLDPERGQPLTITLPAPSGQPVTRLRIHYRTAPQAAALQWLAPEQTLSGRAPFMFSQSESINARSWVPLQDTPALRFTYSASIGAPKGLRVLMGAQASGRKGERWQFSMPQPIPAYLLALAIGELERRELGPRTAVYAEPGRIEAAAREFADTEKMIAAAEKLYGPYRWGRYDMLVLPPSFPMGGMENPRLTFLTPTMIAGDKSLVDLVAHELAHSWSGNLVTNATWKHWWLNEGFTTYVTARITEVLYGSELATMNLQLEQSEARASLARIEPARQALLTRDADADPEKTYTDGGLAYAKGAWLLRTLEQRAGRAVFDPFLRGWFDQHAFQSATTEQFIDYLNTKLLAGHPEIMQQAELDAWLYQPGFPEQAVSAVSERLTRLNLQRQAWLAGTLPSSELKPSAWRAVEWMVFLEDLHAPKDKLAELDARFHLSASGNREIAFRFLLAAIRANYPDTRPALAEFLHSVGRMKFLAPLYRALLQQDAELARQSYAANKARYHPVTQKSLERIFAKAATATETAPAKPAL